MATARFPLRPGRPLVLRWPGRGWGWACDCLTASPRRCTGARAYLRDTHREALADALIHIATSHLTPADAELFDHVEHVAPDDPRAQWDGHTTPEKYERIRDLSFAALRGHDRT